MFPLWIVMIGGLFIGVYSAITVPNEQTLRGSLTADITATNFLAYRASVIDYKNLHPSSTGTIADSSLIFKLGYIRDVRWTNIIQANTLYVYSASSIEPQVKSAVIKKTGNAYTSGIKGSSGNLIGSDGSDTGIVLPASIPVGALTLVGD